MRYFWRNSLTRRYLVASLVAVLLPFALVAYLYDRYTTDLVATLLEERLSSQLTATVSRLNSFMRSRLFQLEALADYPEISKMLRPDWREQLDLPLETVMRFEVDVPDIYGILFFSNDGRLTSAFAGGAAFGAPYGPEGQFSLKGLPQSQIGKVEIIGPQPPKNGQSGWFLLRQALPVDSSVQQSPGKVALHVRLASLTESLHSLNVPGLYAPVLMTHSGKYFTTVGTISKHSGIISAGPEIAFGWRPAVVRIAEDLTAPLEKMRFLLLGLALLSGGGIVWFFLLMTRRMRRQIEPLIEGAEAVAGGQFNQQIEVKSTDEIALLARAFNQMSQQLKQMLASRIEMERRATLGEFSAGVAHEIRNPLATMKTSVQALSSGETNKNRRRIFAMIVEEIDRINKVTQDLLEYARPHPPQKEELAVSELFRRVTTLFQHLADDCGVRITLLDTRNLSLFVDPIHAQQILMNLMLNALQAMPQGGELKLHSHPDNARILIQVSDSGNGMSADQLGKVTTPFFTTKAGNTGLGLAVVGQLVELNDGEFLLESIPGKGTTATLKFPQSKA